VEKVEKLRVLITHWKEHNEEHAKEFRSWVEVAGEAAPDIVVAADSIDRANQALAAALEKLGGPLNIQHHHE
jgi:hypothetical protein